MAKPYQPSRIYLAKNHDPLKHRLVDAAIGLGIGTAGALLAWFITLLVLAHG
jgi:hypothetical protein